MHIQNREKNLISRLPCDDGRFPTVLFELSGQSDHLLFQPKNMQTLDFRWKVSAQIPKPKKNLYSASCVFLFGQASILDTQASQDTVGLTDEHILKLKIYQNN